MNILEIYENYRIPPNLQRHQLEVAAVGLFLIDHWQGPKIHKKSLTKALLLHDMGNIVKFKKPFLGELSKNQKYWEEIQQEYIQKYGSHTHTATETIVKEIGVKKDVLEIIEQMGTSKKGELLTNSWDSKLAVFADTCVTPEGVAGFDVRIQDLISRYNLTSDSSKVIAWRRNAEEVQENIDVELDRIALQDYSEVMIGLRKIEIA